jgi:hypothetical protein
MRQTPHQPHIVANPTKSESHVLTTLHKAKCDFVKCDFHLKKTCRKTWSDILSALFPNPGQDFINHGWLIILEEVIEGYISESDLPNAESYRQLVIANTQFGNMLREEARCATGARKRSLEQNKAQCMS